MHNTIKSFTAHDGATVHAADEGYTRFTLDGVNYSVLADDTGARAAAVTRKHNAVKPSRKTKRLRNTGLVNQRAGDELIDMQADYYVQQVKSKKLKTFTFFDTGRAAAKFEHATLRRLFDMAGAYGASFKIQLETLRKQAAANGYKFDYISTSEYKL